MVTSLPVSLNVSTIDLKKSSRCTVWVLLCLSEVSSLLFFEGSISLELDVGVEFGGTIGAFWDEMEADTADVLLGTEVLEVVDLLTLDLEL